MTLQTDEKFDYQIDVDSSVNLFWCNLGNKRWTRMENGSRQFIAVIVLKKLSFLLRTEPIQRILASVHKA